MTADPTDAQVSHASQPSNILFDQMQAEIESLRAELGKIIFCGTDGSAGPAHVFADADNNGAGARLLRQPNKTPAESGPIAPIAAIRVSEDGMVEVLHLYAPGLPAGEHDLFPVPLNPNGEMRPMWSAQPPSGFQIGDKVRGKGGLAARTVLDVFQCYWVTTPDGSAIEMYGDELELIERAAQTKGTVHKGKPDV